MVFTEPREQLLVSFIFRIYFQPIFISVILVIAIYILCLFPLIAIYILVFWLFLFTSNLFYQVFINQLIACNRFKFAKNQSIPPFGCLTGPTFALTSTTMAMVAMASPSQFKF